MEYFLQFCCRQQRSMEGDIRNEFVRCVVCLTAEKSTQIATPDRSSDRTENLTDTFRWLRNNSPHLNDNTKSELLESGLVDTCLWFCECYFANEPLSRSIVLQFLANICIDHQITRQIISKVFRETLR